jgi:hypothetical protein
MNDQAPDTYRKTIGYRLWIFGFPGTHRFQAPLLQCAKAARSMIPGKNPKPKGAFNRAA